MYSLPRGLSGNYLEKEGREHGSRQQQWRFLLPVVVTQENEQQLHVYIREKQKLDVDFL